MSTDPHDLAGATAAALERVLVESGMDVLVVIPDPHDLGVFTVYLHGNSGRYNQDVAFEVLDELPDVEDVRFGDRCSAILRVTYRWSSPA